MLSKGKVSFKNGSLIGTHASLSFCIRSFPWKLLCWFSHMNNDETDGRGGALTLNKNTARRQ